MELALQRVFALPITQLFTSQATDCSAPGIRAMTDQLQETLRKGVPDYSAILADVSAPPPAVLLNSAASPKAQAPKATPALPQHNPMEDQQPSAQPPVATSPQVRPRPIGRRAVPRALGRASA